MSGMIAGITATPMRRCGSWRTKSASQRLWARLPAIASSTLSAAPAEPGAERRRRDASGAEHVRVGEEHFRDDAFLVEHRVARGGVERGGETAVAAGLLFPFGLERAVVAPHRGAQLGHHLLVLVEAVAEAGVEVVPVDLGRGSGVAVGRDDDVPVHGIPPEVVFESRIRIPASRRSRP